MARKRMVSPELLTSVKVASLPVAARYAFVGLWMYLDDAGRGVDNADLLRAHQWPLDSNYTTRKVERDIEAWSSAGLVCRYEDEGKRLLHVPSWTEHQKVNHPTPSKLTPCPSHEPEIHRAFLELSGRTPVSLTRSLDQFNLEEGSSGDRPDSCGHGHAPQFCHFCRQAGVVAS